MAFFYIKCDLCLGFSHCGSEYAYGESRIELSDEEVNILTELIREKGTTDVDELDLASSHPDLYGKLDDAYRETACLAVEAHWLREGVALGEYSYDEDLMEYFKGGGDTFSRKDEDKHPKDDEEDHSKEDGMVLGDEDDDFEEDEALDEEDEFDEDEMWEFEEWLNEIAESMSNEELVSFFRKHSNANVDVDEDDVDYTIAIPEAIIKMVNDQDGSIINK